MSPGLDFWYLFHGIIGLQAIRELSRHDGEHSSKETTTCKSRALIQKGAILDACVLQYCSNEGSLCTTKSKWGQLLWKPLASLAWYHSFWLNLLLHLCWTDIDFRASCERENALYLLNWATIAGALILHTVQVLSVRATHAEPVFRVLAYLRRSSKVKKKRKLQWILLSWKYWRTSGYTRFIVFCLDSSVSTVTLRKWVVHDSDV